MRSFTPFKASRDRIKRAKGHSNALADAWNEFVAEEMYETFCAVKDDGTGYIQVIPRHDEFPSHFGLELGEFLYQVRAALDNLIFDAAILDSGQNPPPKHEKLEFPICSSLRDFNDRPWKIAPLAEKRRMLVEAVQPYNAPDLTPDLIPLNINRALGMIHDWSRMDRHRELHVVGSWASNASPMFRHAPDVSIVDIAVSTGGFLEHEHEIATFRVEGYIRGMKVDANPDLFIDIALDKVLPPCHDIDTFDTRLKSMIFTTTCIVNAFEKSFSPGTPFKPSFGLSGCCQTY